MKLNAKKCEFGLTELGVLGLVVSAQGIEQDLAKTRAIQEAPLPMHVCELKSFLAVCGYVSKFIPNYADFVEPLRWLTRKSVKWRWGAQSFNNLKHTLSNKPVLACFKLGSPTVLVSDASPVGLGGVLLQEQDSG